jgi:hypothetical protein
LNVTRLGRGPTAAQKVALSWISPICIVEGCYRRRVEHDHREPWAPTRHTRRDELDPHTSSTTTCEPTMATPFSPAKANGPMVPPDDPRQTPPDIETTVGAAPERDGQGESGQGETGGARTGTAAR